MDSCTLDPSGWSYRAEAMNPDAGYTSSPIHPAHGLYALYYPGSELSERDNNNSWSGLYQWQNDYNCNFQESILRLRYGHPACKYVPAQVDIIRSASQSFEPQSFFPLRCPPMSSSQSVRPQIRYILSISEQSKAPAHGDSHHIPDSAALLLHSLTSHMESGNGLRRNYALHEGIPGVQSIQLHSCYLQSLL